MFSEKSAHLFIWGEGVGCITSRPCLGGRVHPVQVVSGRGVKVTLLGYPLFLQLGMAW